MTEYLYTTSATERDSVALDGYVYENIVGYVFTTQKPGTIPLDKNLYPVEPPGDNELLLKRNPLWEYTWKYSVVGYVFITPSPGTIPLKIPNALLLPSFVPPLELWGEDGFPIGWPKDSAQLPDLLQRIGIAGYVFATQSPGTVPLYRLVRTGNPGQLLKIDIWNVTFDLDHAVIGSPQIVDHSTQVLTNETNIEQGSTFKFEIDYTETRNWSTTLSIKGGIQTTVTAGIPSIADGKIQITAEVSSSITWGRAVTTTKKFSQDIPVRIPPHSKVDCRASVSMSTVTIPYSAKAAYRFSGGQNIRGNFTGTYEGATAYQLQASWTVPRST